MRLVMQLTRFVVFSFILANAVLGFENLLFITNYGKIQLYSKPDINSIAGEFSPINTNIKIIFLSRVSHENREILLTDAYKNVIFKYITTPHEIVYIQIGQFNFIGHMTRDSILHLPITEIPAINENKHLHLDLYNTIEKLGESNITVQHALSFAFLMREFELVEDLSRSLDEVFDSQGRDYPSVMAIYITSRTLLNTKSIYLENSDKMPLRETRDVTDGECIIQDDFQKTTDKRICAKYPTGKNCKGMCGPGSLCWSFLCQDCCYHQGCADHDNCCAINGMGNLKCFFPTGFTCKHYEY